VSFPTATIRSGRVAVAKIDCAGILPEELNCTAVRPGFTIDVLPTRVRQGRFVLLSLRIHRDQDATKSLCLVRLEAGPASSLASITVIH